MRITPSFIPAMVSRLMMPVFSGVRLQWRKITSEVFSSVSRSTYWAMASPEALGKGSLAMTFMPRALAMRPVVWPMRPKPMIPAVLSASSTRG